MQDRITEEQLRSIYNETINALYGYASRESVAGSGWPRTSPRKCGFGRYASGAERGHPTFRWGG